MTPAYWITLYALIPMAISIVGGMIASAYVPKPKVLSAFQHFVAGIVIGAVSIELLPKVTEHPSPWTIGAGFIVGVVFMLVLQAVTQVFTQNKSSTGLVIGSAIDLLIDGILIGVSFLAGKSSGIFIALSLSFCAFFLNLTVASTLTCSKGAKWFVIIFIAAMLPIGAFLGSRIIAHLPPTILVETLAFGVAALLYLGIEELLAEGHKQKESLWISSTFFFGFLVILCFKLI